MLILALDTTSRAGSLAIVRDGELIHQISGDPSLTHGQRLPLAFRRVGDGAAVTLADIDLLAVAAGPGSFTGLRVGIAAIQGLAMALDRRVVPVSTLEAVAFSAPAADTHVAAWVDAQRGEVFAQLWSRVAEHGEPRNGGGAQVRLERRPTVMRGTDRATAPRTRASPPAATWIGKSMLFIR